MGLYGDTISAFGDWNAGRQQKKYGKGQLGQSFAKRIQNIQNLQDSFARQEAADQNLADLERTSQNVLSGYRDLANEGLPEESYLAQQEAINSGATQGIQYLQGSRAGIRGIGALNRSTTDAYRELNAMDAQARLANRQNYLGQQIGIQQQLNQQRDFTQGLRTQRYDQNVDYQRQLEFDGMQNKIQGGQRQTEGVANAVGAYEQSMQDAAKLAMQIAMPGSGLGMPTGGSGVPQGGSIGTGAYGGNTFGQAIGGRVPPNGGIGTGSYGGQTFGQSIAGSNKSGYSLR